ncbi:Kinesin-like protein KIN-10B, partial [Linum perenne]
PNPTVSYLIRKTYPALIRRFEIHRQLSVSVLQSSYFSFPCLLYTIHNRLSTMESVKTPKSFKTANSEKSTTMADSSSSSMIRVIVRVRPFLPTEITNQEPSSCVSLLDQGSESGEEVAVYLKDPESSRNECYMLDSFFGLEEDNVNRIFRREVSPLIPGVFDGCNATVFAYGATGSGKTYTMQGSEELPGLMPLAMSNVLSRGSRIGSSAEISYYEVYLDRCYDLLEQNETEISILEDKDGKIHVKGLSQVSVSSMQEFQEVFSRGTRRRKTAHTGLNDVSSRSHGVLVITVSTPLEDGSSISGKLNLIDLAGNEDNRKTFNEGIRLLESAKINQSLFALSNVIYALNNNKSWIPYRESKLTRILQDSLGGTSRALMVACLNPGEYQESVHTVSLASRSRHVRNFVPSAQKLETPKVKMDMEVQLRAWLESKGKTKSTQKPRTCASPFPVNSAKKLDFLGSVKAKVNTHRGASNSKNRYRFATHLLFVHRLLSVPFRNLLLNDETVVDRSVESSFIHFINGLCIVDTENEEEKMKLTDSNNLTTESQALEKKNSNSMEQTPLRKVLSPICSNINKEAQQQATPPKTPLHTLPEENSYNKMMTTPLDKFNVMSSTIKSSLIQEYLNFLNTASKGELLEIKGIGVKLAEYIVEIRETSPLRSLSDLEKIGLSSKQVHNMFNRAARGIFEERNEDL